MQPYVAAVHGLKQLGLHGVTSGGIKELIAVVETNACFADRVQIISGCTIGKNALVCQDQGKTAVVFAVKGEKSGIRVRVLPEFRSLIEQGSPQFYPSNELSDRQQRRQ